LKETGLFGQLATSLQSSLHSNLVGLGSMIIQAAELAPRKIFCIPVSWYTFTKRIKNHNLFAQSSMVTATLQWSLAAISSVEFLISG